MEDWKDMKAYYKVAFAKSQVRMPKSPHTGVPKKLVYPDSESLWYVHNLWPTILWYENPIDHSRAVPARAKIKKTLIGE